MKLKNQKFFLFLNEKLKGLFFERSAKKNSKNMANQVHQQLKFDPKGKAIASLLLGSIGVVLPFLFLIMSWTTYSYPILWAPIFSPVELVIIIIGLILGNMGLKSTKRNFALLGIIMCLVGLGTWLIYIYISLQGTF